MIIRNQSLENLICLILIIHTYSNSDGKNSSNEGVVPILELLKNSGGLLKNLVLGWGLIRGGDFLMGPIQGFMVFLTVALW